MRFVFLRLGSDPIVFLDRLPAWARLDWLTGDRVPDLSQRCGGSRSSPCSGWARAWGLGTPGYGHAYIARHYIPAWAATLAPGAWTAEDEARLIAHLSTLVPR